MSDLLRPDLLLLTFALAWFMGGVATLAIVLKRELQRELFRIWSHTLDGVARDLR